MMSAADYRDTLPSLYRDRSFWGMAVTQFLGAFNDNLFKQIVLLVAAVSVGGDRQSLAMGVFALPFVLFSGFGGYLSDRHSKRRIIVLAKIAEIVVMGCASLAFFAGGHLVPLLAVLFLMGTQSAFFGPAKYGILPEMLRGSDLPRANGWIQMTTFLAIIFGTASAGVLKVYFATTLWIAGALCVLIAVIGTTTALLVRPLRAAEPGLAFQPSALIVRKDTWQMLRGDRPLFAALMASCLFWFVGGLVLPATNALGKNMLQLDDRQTSILAACLGLGIALGCVVTGKLSKGRVSFRLMRLGCWGMVALATLLSLTWPDGSYLLGYWGAHPALVMLGFFAGMYAVPLQVFLQARPPTGQKGRMIGAMNLMNWIGILISAGVYGLCTFTIESLDLPESTTFAVVAVLLLPVAMLYRPHDAQLS